MRIRRYNFFILCLGLIFCPNVFAANADIIQNLQDQLVIQTNQWFAPLKEIAMWLLISLATISWAWNAGLMVLRNADLQEIIVELVKMIIFVGFFMALILNADTWSSAIINGFMWSGNQAVGVGNVEDINPAAILDRGFKLSNKIIESSGTITYIAFVLLALIVAIIYSAIAAYTLLVLAETYIVTAAGVLLLGFGGSQLTSDYAKRYITYCISVGAKLYVLFLIIGLGESFIYTWALQEDKSQIETIIAIIGVLIMLVILIKMIPDILQGVINGVSLGNNTPTISGIAATAGSATLGAAVSTLGAGMAVREASKLATAQFKASSTQATNSASENNSSGSGPLPMPSNSLMKHVGQTAKNIGGAFVQTMGGKVTRNQSTRGPVIGNVAQNLRAQRLGGSSIASSDKSNISGSISQGNKEDNNKIG